MIRAFQDLGCELIFASQAKENTFSEELAREKISIKTISANDSCFDPWIQEIKPDVVIFDRFMTEEQFGWRVQEQLPDAVRVLDTIDLHFLRRHRESGKNDWKSPDVLRELASIYRCDQTWLVSDFEQELLKTEFAVPANLLRRISLGYSPVGENGLEFEQRENFVFIGNFRHPPNWDAVQWLARELWPMIQQQLPQVELHIYGAYPSREAMELDSSVKGLRVFGSVEDQYETLRKYRVNLAPLRFGAGVKGKILDGWTQGTPCLGSPIAAEGMMNSGGTDHWGGKVVESPSEWVEQALKLYRDSDEWKIASITGQQILKNRFSQDEVKQQIQLLVDDVKSGKQRQSNPGQWVGKILWQEQFLAKKYMSKWIEEKNSP